jgi:membrane associated rhomboid family serine protease
MPTIRNRSFGGGGGGGGFSLAFPPFRGSVRALVLINVAVYFLVLFGNIASSGFGAAMDRIFGFVPIAAVHGWLWQFVTYGFLHGSIGHLLINMLMLWMFGSQLEGDWGRPRFLQLYFFCLVMAAATTLGIGYLGLAVSSHAAASSSFWASAASLLYSPVIGASGAIYGVLLAFGVQYAEQELFLFPIPFRIKAKYMTAILVLVVLASALQPGISGIATFAHLGGLFFGWVFLKFGPRRSVEFSFSERYYAMRNAYFKWKRRRAARKFEVYMRKHDRSQYFDEYGNYRDPDKPGKGNGEGRGGWVQ